MEEKKTCKTLPDHLVERIIAMLPFPAIFQARCLSKSWRARFSSTASQDDPDMKRIASSFQELLGDRDCYWKTFCPVFIGTNGDMVAYDESTHYWRTMPSVSFLPEKVLTKFDLQIEGPLLYASQFWGGEEIYVANILTRTWKHLPLPPTSGCTVLTSKLVVSKMSLETYKVILFCQRDLYESDFLLVQIYESKPGSWSCLKLDFRLSCIHDPSDPPRDFNCVYLDRFCYIARSGTAEDLFAFDVFEGTFEHFELLCSEECRDSIGWDYYNRLAVCGYELMMVIGDGRDSISTIVLRIDFDEMTLEKQSELAPSLAALKSSSRAMPPVGYRDHLFFGYVGDRGSRMRAYNIKADLWSASFAPPFSDGCKYRWIASFKPGFAPFMEV